MERITGHTPPELTGLPDLPEAAAHVWQWFTQLSSQRTFGAMSINPITWGDIEAWSRLTGIFPRQWELEAITGIDAVYRNSVLPDLPESKGSK